MKKVLLPALALLAALGLRATSPVLSIQGHGFHLDGRPFDLWGVRVASATQTDALTDQLIANLDSYRAHGVNTVTVSYQGSLGGSSDPFSPDGRSIDPAHQARMERILQACATRNMIVIVGIFYQRVREPRLAGWDAAREAVRTVAAALRPHRHVLLNLANEQGSDHHDTQPWRRVRVPADLIRLAGDVKQVDPARLVGAGGYDPAHNLALGLAPEVDALLYDHNSPQPTSAELAARYRAAGVTKPIVNVELFGAWTRESRPAGVYSEAVKREHFRAIDDALRTPGHYLCFHSSPWLQATTEPGSTIRYDLGGQGTADDRGIRWYFEYLRNRLATLGRGGLAPLRVSENRRFLVTTDDRPFFWLGDTAWELFHRLDRAEADRYLDTRAAQGFNVIQAVALAELDGLGTPNAHGALPLAERDPSRPAITPGANPDRYGEYDYWDHVDYIVAEANRRGLYVGLLPTWGDLVPNPLARDTSFVFNETNAEIYGRFLGARYHRNGVIWILGGDRSADGAEPIWRAMARGLALGATGREDYAPLLMTFHPRGGLTSSTWFHRDDWLDFNMQQTGHQPIAPRPVPSAPEPWERIGADYGLRPLKPVLDGEPLYEDHPLGFRLAREHGYSSDAHVRQRAWWAVFAGAFGHTYGHHSVWQMFAPGRRPVNGPLLHWEEALARPGATQMRHLRALLESRPMLSRVPDSGLVANNLYGPDTIAATRGDGYVFIYSAQGRPFTVNLGRISGERLTAWWFNPRNGFAERTGEFPNTGTRDFIPHPHGGLGTDLVLVLDDTARSFPAPGTVSASQ